MVDNNSDLNAILVECAKLRGCYPLMNRITHQFNWFTNVLVFGWTKFDDYRIDHDRNSADFNNQFWAEQRQEYERIHTRWGSYYEHGDKALINVAKAFLEYCHEQYDDDQTP